MDDIPRYLTVAELIHRLGDEAEQLAGTGLRDARVVDEGLLVAQLAHADGVINGYVSARYPRPFAIVPEVLKGIAHDIVRWRLRSQGGQQTAMNDAVQRQYDEAMRLLRDIQAGRHLLDTAGDGHGPDDARPVAEAMGGTMPASRVNHSLEGWQ